MHENHTGSTGAYGLVPRPSGLGALRNRNFRLYWSGMWISLCGTWIQQVAQAWLVLTLTDNPFILGLVVSAQFGPILALGMFGGILADALPKHRTLLVTQSIAMTLAFTLAILTATGVVQVWHVIVLAFLLGVTNAVDTPTRQSFFAEMVGREELVNATALNSAVNNGARVIGPAIAGLTIGAFSLAVAFFLNGLSFIAVLISLLAMRQGELQPAARTAMPRTARAIAGNVAEGLVYVRGTPHILLALVVVGLVVTTAMNFNVVIPPLARDVLRAGPSGFGFLMAAAGLGSMTAALLVAFLIRPATQVTLGGALLVGVSETVLAISPWLSLSLVCMYGVGLGGIIMAISTNSMIQLSAPDQLRGRAIAVFVTVFSGSTPIGGLIFGALAAELGTSAAVLIGGLAAMSIALVGWAIAWRFGLIGAPLRGTSDEPIRPVGANPQI
jgi:MFS family permease